MSDKRLLIFICRGQARRDIAALSATGESEILRATLRCKRFELIPETCDILTSPTVEEKETAKAVARHLSLGEPIEIPWLNEGNVQTYVIGQGFLGFSRKNTLIIIVEKPVLIKIAAFFEQPSHAIQSGDAFILCYPDGKLEKIQ